MFCPNCGKSDQQIDTYCRSCGEFLPDFKVLESFPFTRGNPKQKAKFFGVLNLIASLLSLLSVLWIYITDLRVPFVLFVGATFLLFNVILLLLNFIFIYKSANVLPAFSEKQNFLNNKDTNELLSEADFSDIIPASVIENTTNKLKKHSDNLTA